MEFIKRGIALTTGLSFVLAMMPPGITLAEEAPPATSQTADTAPAAALFSNEELDQLLAPVALYPDSLLTQIFIASTYPLEVVQATRWVEEQKKKGLKEDQIQTEAGKQSWDASVQALAAFPQVLDMMNSKLDWTQKLGDAVLAQQPDVMASVQRLRHEADAAGSLKSSEQIKVVKESQTIYIQPADPQVIYVPQYNPTVVYGAWPYPAYPPYYYPPPPAYMYPGYDPFMAVLGFGLAVGITAAVWNNNWGHYHNDYNGGSININNSNNNNVNIGNGNNGNGNNRPGGGNRPGDGNRPGNGNRPGGGDGIGGNRPGSGGGKWEHKPEHRKGAEYRDAASRQKYTGQRSPSASTNDFRGRDNMNGRDQMRNMDRSNSSGGANRAGNMDRSANFSGRDNIGGGNRAGSADRSMSYSGRDNIGGGSGGGRADRSSAFQGMGQGGQVRQEYNRGQASREGMSRGGGGGGRSMGGGGGGGGRSMSGGGGGRGGGGGGRGGGGRGGRR